MKDIRPAFRTFLLADPVISTLVGGVRVHYGRLPQNQTEPSVVFNKISEVGDYVQTGDSDLNQIRMQVDAWAQSTDAATQLSDAVRDKLSGGRGMVEFGTDSVTIRGMFVASAHDDYDSVAHLYRASRDYFIWYMTQ